MRNLNTTSYFGDPEACQQADLHGCTLCTRHAKRTLCKCIYQSILQSGVCIHVQLWYYDGERRRACDSLPMNLLWVCNIWPKSRLSWSNWSLNWSWHFMTSLSSLSSVKNAVFNSMYYCATTMSQYRSNKIISLPNQVSLYGISDLKVSHFKVRQIQVESAGGSVGLERLFPAGCLLSWAATARGRCLCPPASRYQSCWSAARHRQAAVLLHLPWLSGCPG